MIIKKSDRKWRSTAADHYLPKPVLEPQQWAVFAGVKKSLGPEYGYFAGSSVSAFIDPQNRWISDDLRSAAYECSVVFAVTASEVKGVPLLFVVDDFYDADIISESQVRCLVWDPKLSVEQWVSKISLEVKKLALKLSCLMRAPNNPVEARVGHILQAARIADWEFRSIKSEKDREELQLRQPAILREVALERLIPVAFNRTDFDKNINKFNVDILIHARQPNLPLLGIEVDGFHHLTPGQQRKDQEKNRFFRSIDLPLVRIHPYHIKHFNIKHFDLQSWNMLESMAYAAVYARLAQLMVADSRRKYKLFLEEQPIQDELDELECKFAHAMYGKPQDELDEKEIRVVWDRVYASDVFSRWLEVHQWNVFERNQYRDEVLAANWVPVNQCPPPRISCDGENYWSAQCVINIKDVAYDIPFPRIKLIVNQDLDIVQKIAQVVFFEFGMQWIDLKFKSC